MILFTKILNSDSPLNDKFIQLIDLSTDIFLDKSSSQDERNIGKLIFSWQIFVVKGIPFELWSGVCEEGLELLKKLLEDPSIPYTELPGFKEFEIRKREKLRAIQKMPEYANRFTMDSYN